MNEEHHILHPDEFDTHRSASSASTHGRFRNGATPFFTPRPVERPQPAEEFTEKKPRFDLDPTPFVDAFIRRWYVLLLAIAIMGALGAYIGLTLWPASYTSSAQLIRNDAPEVSELFRNYPLETATLISMIESPEVLQRTGARLDPPLAPEKVKAALEIDSESSSDITTITATAANALTASSLVNAFTEEAVRHTRNFQKDEAVHADEYIGRQLASVETDLVELRKSMPPAVSALVPAGGTRGRIQLARDELTTLLVRYTEAHPLVREQRAKLAALTAQADAENQAPQAEASAASTSSQTYEVALDRLRTLESRHTELLTRHRIFNLIEQNPPGYLRVLLPGNLEDAKAQRPWVKIGVLAVFFALVGLAGGIGDILLREFFDNRVKTPADIKRLTHLPLLASLGDLRRMTPEQQNSWAFRTWVALQNRMTRSAHRGLICGVTSARPGDGRSTWIRLIAHAATQCGFRVLTISTTPGGTAAAASANGRHPPQDSQPAPAATTSERGAQDSSSLTTNVLTTPSQVAEKLKDPDAESLVSIPLPGWVWNLERRKQWQSALEMWRKIDNIVILVELPPASSPEAVLLAENLPNLVWLTGSGRSDATETRTQLQTLRQARTNLVGTGLNHAPSSFLGGRFARWFACLALLATAATTSAPRLIAQENIPAYMRVEAREPAPAAPSSPPASQPSTPPPAFSVGAQAPRAPWQQRLTLGPGDVLSLSIFGAPELTREEVPISPDGRISYLEAHNVQAAGLTIDELRQRLADELGKFRRAPQPIINPIAYRSKKYFVLGKVVQKGAFVLDRPVTIIEAVARARGFETGLADRNLVELADLSRSFLARGGRHLSINFEKLFLEGDLTQNVPLEPNDYLYFPAGDLKEVYVLGEVMQPGAQTFSQGASALSAIAARGGFTERAWKKRLLVIRGSLHHPEAHVVNAEDVLHARSPDFKLEPKDIIYVYHRPWIRAEELLEIAATAFVEAAVVTWTGINIYPTD